MISAAAKRAIDLLPTYSPEQRSDLRKNCVKRLQNGRPSERTDAVRVLAELDAFEQAAKHADAARWRSLPEADRLLEELLRKPLTLSEEKIVQVLLDNPGATSSDLDRHAGFKGGWHMHFGTMAKERLSHRFTAPPAENRRDASGEVAKFFCGLLADFDEESRGFTMKPAAVEALSRMGLRARSSQP